MRPPIIGPREMPMPLAVMHHPRYCLFRSAKYSVTIAKPAIATQESPIPCRPLIINITVMKGALITFETINTYYFSMWTSCARPKVGRIISKNPINMEFFLPILEIIFPRIGDTKKLVTLNILKKTIFIGELLTR
jgi:hypothetical protein